MPRQRVFRMWVPAEAWAWRAWRARVALYESAPDCMWWDRISVWERLLLPLDVQVKHLHYRHDKPWRIKAGQWLQPFMAVYVYEDTRWAIAHYELQKG